MSTELYTNLVQNAKFKYPREFRTDINAESRQVTINGGTETILISILGIPDGVSPETNEALIPVGEYKRLYIFSATPLDSDTLATIDSFYGRVAYPILTTDVIAGNIEQQPLVNFYMVNDVDKNYDINVRSNETNEIIGNLGDDYVRGQPKSTSTFVEYRYLDQRHLISNIVYDPNTGNVYNMVLPKQPLLVIIMPKNFIRLGLKHGYFRFEENNIIVRVYSKYILSASLENLDDNGEITVFSADNSRIRTIIERFLNRMGIHKIISNGDNQIYGYDQYLTMIVGSVSNTVMP